MSDIFNSGIRPAIDAHLLKLAAEKRDYGNYWSASSGGYCMRKNIFERLGVPHVAEDARKQRVFTAGHIFHDWIQGLTRDAGISIAQEVELQDEDLMVRGHFDDLVLIKTGDTDSVAKALLAGYGENEPDGRMDLTPETNSHLILYDYKTVNSRSFTYAKANGNKMSHFHRLQLGTYLRLLRKANPKTDKWYMFNYDLRDLTEARILKISKDDLRMEEQQLMWDETLEKDVLDYWTTLNQYWVDKKLPPCTCADHEGGFMAREKFNPFFKYNEPCSLQYYQEWKESNNGRNKNRRPESGRHKQS